MKRTLLNYLGCFVLFMLILTLNTGAVSAKPPTPSPVRLLGHVPKEAIANSSHVGRLDPNTQVSMSFTLPLRNQQALQQLLQGMYDPTNQQYGKYLTSEEFIAQFGPSQQDHDNVVAYATSLGLTVSNTHANRTLINVTGTASAVESAFNLELHQYQHASGRQFYAPNNDPAVHPSIAGVIGGVVGLDNHAVWRPFRHLKPQTQTVQTTTSRAFPSGPGGGFAPKDLIAAYNLASVPGDGTGQVIALFELASYQSSDIDEYTNYFSLPPAQLSDIQVDGGSNSGIDAEVTLDIQLALAIAPASQIYVYEGPNSNQGVLDTYNQIAIDNIAQQVSTSWGLGENLVNSQYLQAENAIFQQMAAQGQTIYAAAGDSGAFDDYPNNSSRALVVDDPASQPYVTGVGGTRLTVNRQTGVYVSESVWNDGVGNGGGGGGVSKVWTIPSWQKNVTTTYSKTHRNVPDISLNADPNTGYAIYFNGQWQIVGGTSCAAPLWAAFTARVNQYRATNQLPVLGFVNPLLYKIGTGALRATNFHDVTVGNNFFYKARIGYDNASGWGSFNGAHLFSSLASSSTASATQLLPVTNSH